MKLDMDYESVKDPEARAAFEKAFIEDMARALGVDPALIEVRSVEAQEP